MVVKLERVVALVESGNNPEAFRFEPTVFAHEKLTDDHSPEAAAKLILDTEKLHECSPDSARVILSSSWGKYQLMGFNLWPLGYMGTIWEFLSKPADQDLMFEEFVLEGGFYQSELDDAGWLLTAETRALSFARFYNGLGNPQAYLEKLQAGLKKLS
jgi:hypothetical protein